MSRAFRTLRMTWAGWLIVCTLGDPGLADGPYSLKIRGKSGATGESPLLVEARVPIGPGSYELRTTGTTEARPADVFRDAGKTYLGTILEDPPGPGGRVFEIGPRKTPREPGTGIELIPHGRRVEVRVDGKLVTEYIPDDGPKPYYFPLIGPSGAAMTRAYPMKQVEGEKADHPHHRSFWFTHGSVNKVDFWAELPGHGRIVETSRPTVDAGQVVATIRTTDDWQGPDGRKVCEDERVFRIYLTTTNRVIDFDVTLKATEGPVTFGDTKEGMFGLRVASSMDVTSKPGGRIVNAEGVRDVAAWGKPSPWVDYSGPVDGRAVGVAILNHPSSFRYPTTWHVRDYGLFAANPFGWRDFGRSTPGDHVLPKGESLRFRYRVILHGGDAASTPLPASFRAYEAATEAVIE